MTDDELKKIEELIKKHKPGSSYPYFLTVMFLLFLSGCFKSCGY